MASGSYQKKVCLDRISSLPDTAISQILVYLPIREAVATSKLSRNWKCRWMSIPVLVFEDLRSTLQTQRFDKWVNFINNVLLLHDGNITRFEIRHFLDSASPNVDRWLLLLSRKKLVDLYIQFRGPCSYVCSSSLFNCQALTTLVLAGCGLQVPPQARFNGFINLTVLDLKNVTANKETIKSLVNTSPLLQILVIKGGKPIVSCLNIKAPNLESCTIKGKCKDITFGNTPKLMFIEINACVNGEFARCKLDRILGEVLQLQEARISQPFIEWLNVKNFWDRLSISYYHLKRLHLKIVFGDAKQILAAFWLFRSSPSLKTICIFSDARNEDFCLEEFYETLTKEESTFQSLEVFEFVGFEGYENELKVIQIVLLNAYALETMTIKWKINSPMDIKRESAMVKLLQFQRTSPRAKINLS